MKTDAQKVADSARSVGVPEAQIPNLGMGKIVDMSGELGQNESGRRPRKSPGGTAVERRFTNDRAGLFDEPQQCAVRYPQLL
ncbi:hypothetical protein FHT00_003072 [Sphingomonas insulae]|uniref:Uncharacterized protein n=1 Tax=Sphingomonas insulae TaxID=424800 RepID=A0ABN1HZB8_9SPHN|nr:hypothetical protein [Sphingomonas insulae]NIJ31093.1 hypothetical protein [Sphingomonas insulae]